MKKDARGQRNAVRVYIITLCARYNNILYVSYESVRYTNSHRIRPDPQHVHPHAHITTDTLYGGVPVDGYTYNDSTYADVVWAPQ